MTSRNAVNVGLQDVLRVERGIDAVMAGHLYVSRLGVCAGFIDSDVEVSSGVNHQDVAKRIHGDLPLCFLTGPETQREIIRSSWSNYREACGPHAPKGVAARLRAGVGAACA